MKTELNGSVGICEGNEAGWRLSGNDALDLSATGFSLVNARVCARACADSYGEQSPVSGGQSDIRIEDAGTDTHVLIRDLGDALIVAFRGSASLRNWLTDFDAHQAAIGDSHVHAGFKAAWLSVAWQVASVIHESGRKAVFLAGHSLGGALAAIAGAELLNARGESAQTKAGWNGGIGHSVYTFGQPRVGDGRFAVDARACGVAARHFRVTNRADIVPWAPGWLMGYRHFGQHVHVDALGMHLNPPPGAELLSNGWEIYREFRRGSAAMLEDHPIAQYEDCLHQ
jgi:predicted lipase